jgi:hypothetical protein
MNRRRFIVLASTGVLASIGIAPFLIPFETVIRRIIIIHIGELKILDSTIQSFLDEANTVNQWRQFDFSKRVIIRVHFFFTFMSKWLPFHHKYVHYKNIIIGDFLFSTNYFSLAQGSTRDIEYIGLLNPYKRVCFNPFAGHA